MLFGLSKNNLAQQNTIPPMRRLAFTLAPIVLAWLLYTAWSDWTLRQNILSLQEVAQSEGMTNLLTQVQEGEANVDFALRGMTLRQGKDGLETWNLMAEGATLRQASTVVDVYRPNARYALGNPADKDYVYVRAEAGQVTESNTKLRLAGNVFTQRQDSTITGPVVLFDNDIRILVYPEGAKLDGPVLAGTAQVLRWHLDTDILEAEQGVALTWYEYPEGQSQTGTVSLPSAQKSE